MKLLNYENQEQLELALCKKVADNLDAAIKTFGSAQLLVSGGRTPKGLFNKLSKTNIDWKAVTVGLVDERLVAVYTDYSNENLVKKNLLINNAAEASFKGLVYDLSSKSNNLQEATENYSIFQYRIDVCLLGMGTDGHTASLFPNDDLSEMGLDDKFEGLVLYTNSKDYPTERITCSRSLLLQSKAMYLMINGKEKFEVLQSAEYNALPIASFFQSKDLELITHYTEN